MTHINEVQISRLNLEIS